MAAKKPLFEQITPLQLWCAGLYGVVFIVLFVVIVGIFVNWFAPSPNDVWLFSVWSGMVGAMGGYLFGTNSNKDLQTR